MPCQLSKATGAKVMIKFYSEMATMRSFKERLDYLMLLDGNVKSPRKNAMKFYKSKTWKQVRKEIIFRDLTFDLGVTGVDIMDKVLVHHINPITDDDILNESRKLYDPENLITVSLNTHNIIHYGSKEDDYVERQPGDISPIRR